MKISACFTTYCRFEMTVEAVAQLLHDPRVNDIVILDDASPDDSFERLTEFYRWYPKVKVIRQASNRGMSLNKRDAIGFAINPWCLIGDSDNKFTTAYLDALEFTPELFKHEDEFYMPSWAQPQFDYRAYEGLSINKDNIKEYLDKPMFEQCMNTCNMVVNRDKYLQVYEHNPEVKEVDTLWMNYLWLKSGGAFYVVPNMYYFHRVHDGSGWLQNAAYNIQKGEEIKKLIREL